MSSATLAQPGSEEKILVMCDRYERGEPLFQSGDNSSGLELRDGGYGGPVANMPRNNMDDNLRDDDFNDDDDDDNFGGES